MTFFSLPDFEAFMLFLNKPSKQQRMRETDRNSSACANMFSFKTILKMKAQDSYDRWTRLVASLIKIKQVHQGVHQWFLISRTLNDTNETMSSCWKECFLKTITKIIIDPVIVLVKDGIKVKINYSTFCQGPSGTPEPLVYIITVFILC